jgi:hypothetical protein
VDAAGLFNDDGKNAVARNRKATITNSKQYRRSNVRLRGTIVTFALVVMLVSAVSVCANASDDGSKDWASLPPEAQSSILTELEKSEGNKGNWVQQATLHASGSKQGDQVRFSVAVSGDTIVVGSPSPNSGKGLAYVFVKPRNGWRDMKQTARLSTSDGGDCAPSGCAFGYSAAISGDTIMIGAPTAAFNGTILAGAVYVFSKPAKGWKTTSKYDAKLVGSGAENAEFGFSLAIYHNSVIAAGPDGAAYVFVRPTGGWSGILNPTAALTASNGDTQDGFGDSVAIGSDIAVVGAPVARCCGIHGTDTNVGVAYVFVKPASGWTNMHETARLAPSDGRGFDWFGNSVSISGDTVVAGAFKAPTSQSGPGPGVAYLFVKPTDGWKDMFQTAELTASDGSPGDGLGWVVSVSGNVVAAGAPFATVGSNSAQGAAYVFARPQGGWKDMHETTKLSVSTGRASDNFGFSVGISGKTVVGGAPYASVTYSRQGAAYVFGQH